MGKDDKYTDPELRNEVKEEIHQSDKGGAPGQWSARKVKPFFEIHSSIEEDVMSSQTKSVD